MRHEHDDAGSIPENFSAHRSSEPAAKPHVVRPQVAGSPGTSGRLKAFSQSNTMGMISVGFILSVFRQWWKVATPLGVLMAGAGAAALWWSFKPSYEASAWLRIEDRRPYIAFPTRDESRRFVSTQVELIRSPLVIGPAISKPEVARAPELAGKLDPIAWLGTKINVRPVGNSELFVVSYASPDPTSAAAVVTEVVNSYLVLRGSDDAERTERIVKLLTEEQRRREKEVDLLREDVRKMSVEKTGKDPFADASTTPLIQDPLSELQTQMSSAEVERTIAEVQLQVLEESVDSHQAELSDEEIAAEVEKHPAVIELRDAIKQKTALLSEYEARLVGGKENRLYIELADRLRENQEQLPQLRERLQQELLVELQQSLQAKRAEELAVLRRHVEQTKTLEQALQERYLAGAQNRSQLSGVTVDLEFKRAELLRAQAVHNEIADRIVTLKTEQRAPERVELLQKAAIPAVPLERLPWKKLYMLCLALFSLPFGLAVLWEMYVRRVGDAEGLERDAQLAVVGEISRLPARSSGLYGLGSRRVERALSLFEESIDSLRTSLLLSDALKDMKVILVTSAASGEGKTSVSVQLAVSLARASGKRTLLVDGDMRSPDIHRLLGLSLEPGLCDVLAGTCSLEEAIQADDNSQLHVLTAGEMQMSPHRLVGNGTLRPTFEAFRAAYDYVVVDSPPVLAVSESLVLARQADASLVCAMRDTSRVDQVRRAYSRLLATSGRPVGVVLNGVPTDHYYRRYGGYYPSGRQADAVH